ncbi:cilia- and flagella-associated protein 206-like isoform X1 [Centruroides sculpturatus]|uniref:cilia- and flagella-associated protein 206-like isoform X1 n=3 Tax=Centruroides sculpturatus TaxID=218467 RepID=UPI000C6ECAFB|nr:cilia- and flagella-associated protein 206-like isoform X1 [Centruroides sculpturatus]
MDYESVEIMSRQLGRRIVAEIIERCKQHNEDVTEELAFFIIRIVSTDPDYTNCIRNDMLPEEEENLIKHCCDLLLSKKNPSIDTMKMQVHYKIMYKNRDEFLTSQSKGIKKKSKSFFSDVLKVALYTAVDFRELEYAIVSYFLVKSGIGLHCDRKLKQELIEILKGILPPTELRIFISMEEEMKKEQLDLLSQVTVGIGIYNGRYKNSILKIDNVINNLKETIPVFSNKLTSELQKSKKFSEKLTSILEDYTLKSNKEKWSTKMIEILDLLIEVLINIHQYEVYLTTFLKETDISNKKTQEFSEELENTMFHLHQIITATAEPIQQCLPSFILLYKIWLNMQDEITYLNILSTLANNIFRCVENSHKLVNDEKLEYLIENFEKVHEVKTFPQTEDISDSISASKNTVIYFPVSISNFSKMQLQFGGYCPWAICYRDGALLPANRELGVIMFKNEYYGFCNREGRNEFLHNPDSMIAGVVMVAKKHPSLILFLHLNSRFILPFLNHESIEKEKPVFTSECETQTESSLIRKVKSPKYKWNEWDFRREALQLANLQKKQTHSTQSEQSYFCRDNCTQTFPPKDNFCQTKRDNSTTMSKYSLSNHLPL